MKCRFIMCAAIAASGFAAASLADSVDIAFTRISSNAAQNVESQFVVTATEVTGNASVVDFIFRNNVGTASSITTIYFDNGSSSSLFSGGSIVEQIGANFSYGAASPPNLPGGDSIASPFTVTPGFLADAKGNPDNGLNAASELVRFRFSFLGGVSFADVVAALQSDALRIGFHVRSIGDDGDSDSFVSEMPPPGGGPMMVPVPSPMFLGAAGLGAVASFRRRR